MAKEQPTIRVRISAAIDREYTARDVYPYATKGVCNLTAEQAQELLDDAAFNSDEYGPDYSAGTRRAYAKLEEQLRAALTEQVPA